MSSILTGSTILPQTGPDRPRAATRWPWIAAHLLGAACLLWVAIANGFPLLFSDSGGYLRIGTELHYTLDRPVTYGLLIAPFARIGGLWAVIAAQALFASWIIGLTVTAILRRRAPGTLLATLAALAVASSLPWFAGEIMPDLFTGLVALTVFLILFAPEPAAPWQRWLLPLLLAGMIATHLSHIAIAAGLAVVGTLALAWREGWRPALPRGGRVAAAAVAAVLGLSAMNFVAAHQFRPSLETNQFLVARLFDGRVGQPVLERLCARQRWLLCIVRPMVDDPARAQPGQDYLWAPDSQRGRLEHIAPDRLHAEEAALAHRVFAQDPGGVLHVALAGWGRQIVKARAADGMTPYAPDMQVVEQVHDHFPGSYRAFEASREQRGTLQMLAAFPDRALALVIALLTPLIAWQALRLRDDRLIGLVAIVLATLIGNAAVCGILSGPADRYQSRVLWLLPLLTALSIARFRPRRTRSLQQDEFLGHGRVERDRRVEIGLG